MRKRILISVMVFLFAFVSGVGVASATDDAQFKLGVEAGAEISNPSSELTGSTGVGFKVGVVGEYDFTSASRGWYVGTGVGLVFKPWKTKKYEIYGDDGKADGMYKVNSTPYYLRIPVVGGYRFALSSNVSLGIQTGIYMSTGLFGKNKDTLYITWANGEPGELKSKANCFDSFYDRLDWGWTVGANLRCGEKWQVNVGYDYQFNSLLGSSMYKVHNRTIEVGLTYYFR